MINAEFKYLKKHWFQLIILVVIATIPAIYAVTFLKSMWDPYGKTQNLDVAVVNHDRNAKMNGTKLSLGKDLTHNLKSSKALGFHHVSAKQAQAGLKQGKYYGIYTIPASFSKNATTVFSSHPKQLNLKVTTSSGQNYIAGKFATSAGSTIQAQLNSKLNAAYTKTLVNGMNKIASGMTKAQQGAAKLATGSQQEKNGINQFGNGLSTATTSQQTLAASSAQLANGTKQYTAGVASASNGSQSVDTGLMRLSAGLPALTSGLNQMAAGTNTLSTGMTQASTGSATLAQGAAKLSQGMNAFTSSSGTLAAKSKQFDQSLKTFSTQVKQSENAGTGNLGDLTRLLQATQSTLNQLSATQAETAKTASNNVAKAAEQMRLSASQTKALTDAVNQTDSASTTKQTAALKPLLAQLQTALTSLQRSQTTQQQSVAKMDTSLNQLTGAADQLASSNASLAGGASTLKLASSAVANGAAKVSSANHQLASGATTLNSSLAAALPQVGTLTNGAGELTSGANQLSGGLDQLATKGSALANGSAQLTAGANKLAAGGQQLKSATGKLQSGATSVATGNKQLTSSLAAGNKQLPKLHFTKANEKMAGSPTKVSDNEKDRVPNNGTSMFPYMGGVAIYICAIAVNLMFDTVTPRKRPKHVYDVWLSKSTIIYLVATLAATIEYALVVAIDGLNPTNPFTTWVILALGGLAFMSIVTWLNLVLKQVGTFIAMVLLVLQLGSSGGTYPVVLSNGFFQALHPFLPMTYLVDGLRHTVMMNSWPTQDFLVLLSFFVVFTALMFFNYVRRYLRTNKNDLDAMTA